MLWRYEQQGVHSGARGTSQDANARLGAGPAPAAVRLSVAHQGSPVAPCSASSTRAASATLGQAPSSAWSARSAAPPLASSSTDCVPRLPDSAWLAASGSSTGELASLSSEVLLANERRDAAQAQRVPVQSPWASRLTLRKARVSG